MTTSDQGSVWVLQAGEYADSYIAGIYSTKSTAQAAADAGSYHQPTISQWVLDPSPGDTGQLNGLQPFTVTRRIWATSEEEAIALSRESPTDARTP